MVVDSSEVVLFVAGVEIWKVALLIKAAVAVSRKTEVVATTDLVVAAAAP